MLQVFSTEDAIDVMSWQHWWDVLTVQDPMILPTLLWTGLISTALALYLETVALKVVSASELTILMTSISIFGSAFAFVTMGETMDTMGLVGGALIVGSWLVSAMGGGSNKATAAAATKVATFSTKTTTTTLELTQPSDMNACTLILSVYWMMMTTTTSWCIHGRLIQWSFR